MVTEPRGDVEDDIRYVHNGSDEGLDYDGMIRNLGNEKLKLLKEQKTLYHLLADKEEQILKISEIYKSKWESVCEHLRYIELLCSDVPGNGKQLSDLKMATSELINSISSPPNMDTSISSYFTATDTAESTFSSSSESIVANHNNDTLTKFTGFQSLNNLVNDTNCLKTEDDYNHLKIDEHECRSHSDCLKENNDFPARRSGIETDTSESLFRIADDFVRRSKKLTKKASNKTEKTSEKSELKSNPMKPISEFTNQDVFNWLINVARLPKILLDDIRLKNKINGKCLDQITEQKFDKLFGTSDKLIKKKVLIVLEEYKNTGQNKPINIDDISVKDHTWVANIWLKKHLGLTHLAPAFLSRCVDGRLLKFIAQNSHSRMKDFLNLATTNYEASSGVSATPLSNVNKAIHEPSKSDLRSLRFGLLLLMKFDFNISELEKRRAACEDLNKDVLVWTNERFAKWFQNLNLKNYIRGIEYSGIHGGMMVLDSQFSVASMSKLIQMPPEVAKKNNIEEKISILLKPSRFNEGIKSRRSTSIFRRRSLSQPRFTKSVTSRTANVTPDISDSASNNDSINQHHQHQQQQQQQQQQQRIKHKDKSQTIDVAGQSPSTTNHNFIRKYRRPDCSQPSINITDTDPDNTVQSPSSPNPRPFVLKSPAQKLSSFPFKKIASKLRSRSDSGSDNEEDFEV